MILYNGKGHKQKQTFHVVLCLMLTHQITYISQYHNNIGYFRNINFSQSLAFDYLKPIILYRFVLILGKTEMNFHDKGVKTTFRK